MLKVQEIRELIKLVNQSNIDEFEYEQEGTRIKMKKSTAGSVAQVPVIQQSVVEKPEVAVVQPPQATVAAKAETIVQQPVQEVQQQKEKEDSNLHKITSPMVGTFYQSPSPGADAYVKPGSRVTKDSIVCIVEAMKLFNEIEAEVDGEIVEVLVKDGQLVEYGQPLFLVKVD
ncbi:acetyl-CoA carboxylase biotin carboxyl carrier protein [Peribacillus tepidiphilus]|uniref:acetyl-CoA carboxylase biotin carboxyl carrier protein n=1 Tax=Peribacillus tepidiphilus TaxID=2652445 RepID=UPI0035B50561